MTMTMAVEMPDSFSLELRSLLTGLLQRDVHKRLGCRGRGADEIKSHPFFRGIDWRVVFLQRLAPPLIPARGEVNAADAFDIGSFDDEDTKHIKLTDADQELYRNFPVVVSERWQHEIAETIFDYINHEADKAEMKRKDKNKFGFRGDEQHSDCILHGYMKRLGGTFTATWLTRYVRLYPNRLELWTDSGKQPELIFMDQMEEVCEEFVQIKNEQCIVIKLYNHSKYVLTNSDEIGLKEWHVSLKAAHRESMDMMTTMAEKATKIYGTEIPLKHMGKRRRQLQQQELAANAGSLVSAPAGLQAAIVNATATAAAAATVAGSAPAASAAAAAAANPIANWEQKIIQKELQASSSIKLPSSSTSSFSTSNSTATAPAADGPAAGSAASTVASATPSVAGRAPKSALPVSRSQSAREDSAANKHAHRPHHHAHRPHHHHHHHHHQHHRHHHHHHLRHQPADGSSHHQHHARHSHAHQPHSGANWDQKQLESDRELAASQEVGERDREVEAPMEPVKQLEDTDNKQLKSSQSAAGQKTCDQPTSGHPMEQPHEDKQQQQQQQPTPDAADENAVAPETPTRPLARREDSSSSIESSASSSASDSATGDSSSSSSSSSSATPGHSSSTGCSASPDEGVAAAVDKLNLDSAASADQSDQEKRRQANSSSSNNNNNTQEAAELTPDEEANRTPVPSGELPEAGGRVRLAVSLENVSEQQEVLRDPSKRITSDNKQREQDLVAQYEKLHHNNVRGGGVAGEARHSSSSIDEEKELD